MSRNSPSTPPPNKRTTPAAPVVVCASVSRSSKGRGKANSSVLLRDGAHHRLVAKLHRAAGPRTDDLRREELVRDRQNVEVSPALHRKELHEWVLRPGFHHQQRFEICLLRTLEHE